MTQLYMLFEHAVGYCLFRVKEFEEIGAFLPQVEDAVKDSAKFQKVVQLVGFRAFKNAALALENMNAVSEGILTEELSAFLRTSFPHVGKGKVILGVSDPKLGASINEALSISVSHIGAVPEIVRGIRLHLTTFVKGLTAASMQQSELGLGHAYSRGKVKFNVNRVDNMIIQSIALVDQLDKDINTFSMRIREWYSYHFPELAKIVTDNYQYVQCVSCIKDRTALTDGIIEKLEAITMDSSKAQAVIEAVRMTMGMDISPIDLINIEIFAKRVASLAEYRVKLATYLRSKMNAVAPNLATLIGEVVGARLISHAGSLTNLAKYPASTVQILGAEKALFRALKTRGKTPKYGLIFHSTFIGRAAATNKGRISRYLANKCSLASRIDCFSETQTSVFGQKLKDQVEERLKFYESGDLPRKNIDVMAEACSENQVVVQQILKQEKKDRKKKRKAEQLAAEEGEINGEDAVTEETPKKKKKKKNISNETLDQTIIDDFSPSPIKKKKKSEEVEALNGGDSTLNTSSVETGEEGEGTRRKKKKKKKQEAATDDHEDSFVMDTSLSFTLDTSGASEELSAKKKKKKKQMAFEDSQEDSYVDTTLNSTMDSSAVAEELTVKKKKKKVKAKI